MFSKNNILLLLNYFKNNKINKKLIKINVHIYLHEQKNPIQI